MMAILALIGTVTFPLAMGLKSRGLERFSEIIGVVFHVALLPIVAALPAPDWAKTAGASWLAIDIMVGAAIINHLAKEISWPLRLGGHVLAGIWIVAASLSSSSLWFNICGVLLGVGLGGYSLVAPWVPQRVLLPTGFLMVAWLITISRLV